MIGFILRARMPALQLLLFDRLPRRCFTRLLLFLTYAGFVAGGIGIPPYVKKMAKKTGYLVKYPVLRVIIRWFGYLV